MCAPCVKAPVYKSHADLAFVDPVEHRCRYTEQLLLSRAWLESRSSLCRLTCPRHELLQATAHSAPANSIVCQSFLGGLIDEDAACCLLILADPVAILGSCTLRLLCTRSAGGHI